MVREHFPLLPFDSAQGKLAQYKLAHVTRLSLVGKLAQYKLSP
jgi:hypothetical protein